MRSVLPAAATLALCFSTGGYFPGATALAAIVALLAVVLRLTLARRPWEGWSVALSVGGGALALFAVWTLTSSGWSGASGRALLEFDRALLYLAVLVFFGLAAARPGELAALLRWTGAAILVVGSISLVARLSPETIATDPGVSGERLSFPFTYWNSMGVLTAVGLALCLYVSSSARQPAVARVVAAAAFPVLAVTLYFTFSRGGIVVAGAGLLVYVVAGHPRGLLPALLAIAPTTYYALARAYDAQLLAGAQFDQPAAAAEREDVLTAVVVCAVAAAVLRAILLLADRWLAPLRVTRRWAAAGLAALVLAIAGGAVAAQVPDRIDRERRALLRDRPARGTEDLRNRLLRFENNRAEHWRVALDAYRAEPLHGTGAGTFQLEWERDRPTPPSKVRDAHSLYIEALSELGWVGLLLLVVALGTPLAIAVVRLWGPDRHAHAGFVAASGALLAHAGLDWDWEMPALFVWFFAASGVVLAGGPGGPEPGRLTRLLGGLACLALVLTPVLVYRSQGPLERSGRALHAGDCRTAVGEALDSLEALSARAAPFEVLGYCDARAGEHRLAVRAMAEARDRDPGNWVYAYGLAVTQALAGQDPRAAIADARRLNPLDSRVIELERGLRSRSPERRRRAAARAEIPYE